jgi:hypothetical protein
MKILGCVVSCGLLLGLTAAIGCSDGGSSSEEGNTGATSSGNASSGGSQGSSGKGGGGGGNGESGATGSGGSTGKGGSTGSSGSPGAGGADAECTPEGDDCTPGSNECCEGGCIESDSEELAGCRPLCNDDEECDSGCCLPFSNASGGFCVAAAHCTCIEEGDECGDFTPSQCCEGTACASTGGGLSCTQTCTDPGDCATNCCVPLPNTDFEICAPENYCP